MKQRVRVLDADFRARASEEICRVIAADAEWKSAGLIAAFLPLPSEPQIAPLFEEKSVCIPRVRGEMCDLVLLPRGVATDWRLTGATFDALEAIDPAQVDLILVPGVAFTKDGARLGRGRGYYDRLLASCPPSTRRIGVSFAVQIAPALPLESHDQRVDRVITETADV